MRAAWKEGVVVSLKFDEKLYGLAQMTNKHAQMRLFLPLRQIDDWNSLDPKELKTLFCVDVGNIVLNKLGVRRVPPKELIAPAPVSDQLFIEVLDNADGHRLRNEFFWRGGNLVDLGPGANLAGFQAPVIKHHLDVKTDYNDIVKYELTNMYGAIDIQRRVLSYRKSGVNINPLKFKVFPGLMEAIGCHESDFVSDSMYQIGE